MYTLVSISNVLPPDKRKIYLEDSRATLRKPSLNPFYPEGYQLEFAFSSGGNVHLTVPPWVHHTRYFWGSPDNRLGKTVTEDQIFYERRTSAPKVVRGLWLKLFPPKKIGLYSEVPEFDLNTDNISSQSQK